MFFTRVRREAAPRPETSKQGRAAIRGNCKAMFNEFELTITTTNIVVFRV